MNDEPLAFEALKGTRDASWTVGVMSNCDNDLDFCEKWLRIDGVSN